MTLRTKFNLVLFGGLATGLGLSTALSYRLMQANAEAEVLNNARIMMESALAIRTYTSDQVAPLLHGVDSGSFIPETVPSYAAQTNFRMVRQRFPDYSYKEAALNPTNLSDRATDWEADIIRVFRDDPGRAELSLQRETATGRALVLARPLQIKNPSCLSCHDRPESAPRSVVAAYGPTNGFGWRVNDVIGAQIVSVPIDVSLHRARATFFTLVAVLVGAFVILALLLNVLLEVTVIRPVLRLSAMAAEASLGKLDSPEYKPAGDDEIASLATSFNRMRRSLQSALKMLSE